MRCARGLWLLLLWMVVMGRAAQAQEASVGAAIRSLANAAECVFIGQVVRIDRTDDAVAVVFRVDGVLAGSAADSFTLREWAGLWPPGMQRYAVGQRMVLFVNAPSAVGFSTPVRGAEGVVPARFEPSGDVTLDVTRLAAEVVRAPGAILSSATVQTITLADAVTLVRGRRLHEWHEPGVRIVRLPMASHRGVPEPFAPEIEVAR